MGGIITERASRPLIKEKDPEIRQKAIKQIVKVALHCLLAMTILSFHELPRLQAWPLPTVYPHAIPPQRREDRRAGAMYHPRAKKVDLRALQKLIILCLIKIAFGRFLCNRLDLFLWGLLHKKAALESYLVVSSIVAIACLNTRIGPLAVWMWIS